MKIKIKKIARPYCCESMRLRALHLNCRYSRTLLQVDAVRFCTFFPENSKHPAFRNKMKILILKLRNRWSLGKRFTVCNDN